jgi:phospholipid-translocating ATPase
MIALSIVLTVFNEGSDSQFIYFCKCVLLLSSIIPIGLRVNLDQAKIYYSYLINTDEDIKGSITRNLNICEDLGRLSYLITDKTGTLTQNDMTLK